MLADDAISLYGSLFEYVLAQQDNFYVRSIFRPPNAVHSGFVLTEEDARHCQPLDRLMSCERCAEEQQRDMLSREQFDQRKQPPLRILDLFAGAGALGFGLEQGSKGCSKVTHAVEISPSAIRTIRLVPLDMLYI